MSADNIILEPENLAKILKILHGELPAGCEVYLFGSRANGRARKYSDVDLALKNGAAQIDRDVISRLRTAFEFSDLPYRVDLIDLNGVKGSFHAAIQPELIRLVDSP